MTDFATTKAQFHLPSGMIYLDGNSLGPLPTATAARVAQTVTSEWGEMLIPDLEAVTVLRFSILESGRGVSLEQYPAAP